MGVKISRTNPLRFKSLYASIDYNNYYPRFDLMEFRNNYQRGVYSASYYANFALNDTIIIQLNETSNIIGATVRNMTTGGTTAMSKTDVTPTGWATPNIYNLSILTNTLGEGVYRIEFFSTSEFEYYRSDEFIITDPSLLKDLVKIQWYDSKNSFDGVFWNGTSWIWQPTRYFTGLITVGEGSSEYSMYKNQKGVPVKLRAEDTDSMTIDFTKISQYEYSIIRKIFGCDNILVNGISVQNEDKPSYEPIEKTDLCDVSITATITEDDNNSYIF